MSPTRAALVLLLAALAAPAGAELPPWFAAQPEIRKPDFVTRADGALYLCWLRRTPRGALTPDWAGVKLSLGADQAAPWSDADAEICDPARWWSL